MSQETKKYLIEEALGELNSKASKKFTESLDISINLGIDASKSDQNVRGASNLPHGNGKSFTLIQRRVRRKQQHSNDRINQTIANELQSLIIRGTKTSVGQCL